MKVTAMQRAFMNADPSKYDRAVMAGERISDHWLSPEEFEKALEQAEMAATGNTFDMLFRLRERYETHGMKAFLSKNSADIINRLANEGDMMEQMGKHWIA